MCLFPIKAIQQEFGRPKFHPEGELVLPCGKCSECISKRALEWALRARHEISCHQENSFITLTYNDDNLPSIFIVKDQFQKFIKRLRKHLKRKIMYMVSHEYGSKTFRPHHHAIIFGYNPQKQKYLKTTKSGEPIFTSLELEKLWTHGFSSVGSANEKTAYYIASYALKGKTHTLIDPITAEEVEVSDCMDVSKRPAIGYNYFLQNQKQLVDSGDILPRYYLKKLKDENPSLHERYENDRLFNFKTRSSHELLAKFEIDSYKKSTSSEFRAPETQNDVNSALREQLISNRNLYQYYKTKD